MTRTDFIYSIAGNLLDRFPGKTGYMYMFTYMFVSAAVGGICAMVLHKKIKKENAAAKSGC